MLRQSSGRWQSWGGVKPLFAAGAKFYEWVAANRNTLAARTTSHLHFAPVRIAPTRLINISAGLLLVCICVQNFSGLPATKFKLPEQFVNFRQFFGFAQNWNMFAPYPETVSAWAVIEGKLIDGSIVDVYNKKPGASEFTKPKYVSHLYYNYRWRRFLSSVEDQSYAEGAQRLALNYGRYLCRSWNKGTPNTQRLSTFKIYFNAELTRDPGLEKLQKKRLVWEHDCFK